MPGLPTADVTMSPHRAIKIAIGRLLNAETDVTTRVGTTFDRPSLFPHIAPPESEYPLVEWGTNEDTANIHQYNQPTNFGRYGVSISILGDGPSSTSVDELADHVLYTIKTGGRIHEDGYDLAFVFVADTGCRATVRNGYPVQRRRLIFNVFPSIGETVGA